MRFGIKTSQANTAYGEILKIWREADAVPEIENAWLWDHLVPLRGDVTGSALEAWTLLAALARRRLGQPGFYRGGIPAQERRAR